MLKVFKIDDTIVGWHVTYPLDVLQGLRAKVLHDSAVKALKRWNCCHKEPIVTHSKGNISVAVLLGEYDKYPCKVIADVFVGGMFDIEPNIEVIQVEDTTSVEIIYKKL